MVFTCSPRPLWQWLCRRHLCSALMALYQSLNVSIILRRVRDHRPKFRGKWQKFWTFLITTSKDSGTTPSDAGCKDPRVRRRWTIRKTAAKFLRVREKTPPQIQWQCRRLTASFIELRGEARPRCAQFLFFLFVPLRGAESLTVQVNFGLREVA